MSGKSARQLNGSTRAITAGPWRLSGAALPMGSAGVVALPFRRVESMTFAKIAAVVLLALQLGHSQVRAEENAEPAARTVVENEGKFFEMAQEQGTRAAFLHFLAQDSIVFQPGPVNGREAWTKRPEGGIWLTWKPLFVAMSRSVDLAYTTGPAEWRRKKEDAPFGYGQFVSIWRKQKDGAWKVALDVGGEVPGASKGGKAPPLEISLSPDDIIAAADQPSAFKKLREAETKFTAAAKSDSTAALLAASSTTVRVHREGVLPALGKEAAGLMLSVRKGKLALERMGGGVSQAGDLAYSYGRYALTIPQKTEHGHYLQIWRTDKYGWWQIALDYQTPSPPEPKQPSSAQL